ncbi:DUF4652 domain-containing protein [Acetanaerobacterium elongatum]|uniref:WD40-like Beta Propeller Repeat n=1 Tax=Acetanaerobacterium elongatum TaxID=258515 RepID=A0A1H0AKB2_9FIRM|nr:DUF4652 domain-containing protein [Acetanaerobacterium elongatum]SDN33978.1 protein of unknown function [Acetanaerobacterium elongatum]
MCKHIKKAAALSVTLAVLLSGCGANGAAPLKEAASSSSSQDISSETPASSRAVDEWMLSATARNAAFQPYMSIQEYDVLFGTSGMMPSSPVVSPNGKKLAYIYPNEFEEPCDLFLYDLVSKKAEKILPQQKLPQSSGFKQVAWADDGSLLLIIGYRYGTVTPGGSVYLLKLAEAPALRLLYEPQKDTEQVLSASLSGSTLTMKMAVFDKNMEKYTEEQRTAEVNPQSASVSEAPESSPAVDSDILATLFNFPSKELLAVYTALDTFEYDQSGESLLLVPNQTGTRVIIETLEYDSVKNDFVPVKTVYDKTSKDGYALWLKAVRPEGGIQLRITLKHGKAMAQYDVTYNGKDGNEGEEVIKKAS